MGKHFLSNFGRLLPEFVSPLAAHFVYESAFSLGVKSL